MLNLFCSNTILASTLIDFRENHQPNQKHITSAAYTLQEHPKIQTNASAGNDSDLLRVPLPAPMFLVTQRNQNVCKVFSDI